MILKWIRVSYVQRYTSISYDNVWTNKSDLCALLCIELIMLLWS